MREGPVRAQSESPILAGDERTVQSDRRICVFYIEQVTANRAARRRGLPNSVGRQVRSGNGFRGANPSLGAQIADSLPRPSRGATSTRPEYPTRPTAFRNPSPDVRAQNIRIISATRGPISLPRRWYGKCAGMRRGNERGPVQASLEMCTTHWPGRLMETCFTGERVSKPFFWGGRDGRKNQRPPATARKCETRPAKRRRGKAPAGDGRNSNTLEFEKEAFSLERAHHILVPRQQGLFALRLSASSCHTQA